MAAELREWMIAIGAYPSASHARALCALAAALARNARADQLVTYLRTLHRFCTEMEAERKRVVERVCRGSIKSSARADAASGAAVGAREHTVDDNDRSVLLAWSHPPQAGTSSTCIAPATWRDALLNVQAAAGAEFERAHRRRLVWQ
ncbi:hypothetical protein EON68_04745 [archaeon]|nr:MAG: hypothetical protein EON68_04745 [archaeon]